MSLAEIHISDIHEDGRWVTLKVKVLQLWEPNSDSMKQVGLLGDENGKIKFVSWKKTDLPEMEEGKSYLIKAAVVDSWNDRFQVNLNSRSSITELDEDVEVFSDDGFEDVFTSIIPKSGYIERCPECKRILVNDHCPVHIDVEPLEDVRVKASLANSGKIAVANGKVAEALLGLSLDQVKNIDKEDMDCLMYAKLVGKRFRFKASEYEENLVVHEIEEVGD